MEQIAPLARILAEANGIDWQQLRGSGSGGTVVEQDILNYLSRIMSGEEEPPSTPVDDMPEGWTGDEQLPAGMFSAAQLSEAGIDSDIADFVTQTRAPEVPATPSAPSLSHDAMDFELDDEVSDLDAPLAAEPQPVATDWSFAPAQSHAPQAPHVDAPQPMAPAPEPAFPSLSAPEPVPAPEVQMPAASASADVAAPPAAAGGLSGLLSRLYRKDNEAPPAPMPAPQPEVQQPASQPAPFAGQHVGAETAALDFQAPVVEAPVVEELVIEAPLAEAPAAELAEPEVVAPAVEVPELQAPEPQAAEPQAAQPPVPVLEDDLAPNIVAEQQPTPQPVAASPAMPASAVWFGTYLRRDAQVGAADDLRAQLSEALGQDVSLAFLVARAAQRHADVLGLDLGTVALHSADGQNHTVTGGALRDAVNALHGGQDSATDLLVTDAGALGVDDLHYPHTLTLSLGRVQDGRAALSLNGDVEPRQAAQFLSRVAEALEKPIALVL
ncbi:E3 binding domain-containing protein [Deinococcus humi]|uniref:Peripheral subunit-binding (PSBD) domain-containing protein n=1 Tax=Deinococcus humi TaxID=662880 RepID=A0A7W8NDC0_9DEIO|nr:E3 binding domain-containing protein [Deinococcus humi]MBB5361470.1 hypothetical protein [Deinococcus humi]GGO20231.1 hypothetical protein GCM10008949_05300 [Deinococcus humi]